MTDVKMKRKTSTKKLCFRVFAYVALILTSCDIERSDNGKIDGFWQLTSVDTLATGGQSDMHRTQLTWAFQGPLLELRYAPDRLQDYYMSFQLKGDSLILFAPYYLKREQGDIRMGDIEVLRPYGINSLEERFFLHNFV